MTLRTAGLACAIGATITTLGGIVTQAARGSAAVSEQTWSYPWSSDAFIPISLLWALNHVLVLVGIVGLRRSGLAGPSRSARVGLGLAITGTAVLLAGELGSLPIGDQHTDATIPLIVGAIFGFGTFCSAIGLLLAAKATLQARIWRNWRRFTPLICGISTIPLIVLSFADLLPVGVAVYGAGLLGLGIAMLTERSPSLSASIPSARPGKRASTKQIGV